jgi:hypothetical protein
LGRLQVFPVLLEKLVDIAATQWRVFRPRVVDAQINRLLLTLDVGVEVLRERVVLGRRVEGGRRHEERVSS